jgi:hypothetical protein
VLRHSSEVRLHTLPCPSPWDPHSLQVRSWSAPAVPGRLRETLFAEHCALLNLHSVLINNSRYPRCDEEVEAQGTEEACPEPHRICIQVFLTQEVITSRLVREPAILGAGHRGEWGAPKLAPGKAGGADCGDPSRGDHQFLFVIAIHGYIYSTFTKHQLRSWDLLELAKGSQERLELGLGGCFLAFPPLTHTSSCPPFPHLDLAPVQSVWVLVFIMTLGKRLKSGWVT